VDGLEFYFPDRTFSHICFRAMLNWKNILQQIVSSQTELQKVLDEFLLLVNLFTFFFQTKDILLLKLE
jgi:hypothetical protein